MRSIPGCFAVLLLILPPAVAAGGGAGDTDLSARIDSLRAAGRYEAALAAAESLASGTRRAGDDAAADDAARLAATLRAAAALPATERKLLAEADATTPRVEERFAAGAYAEAAELAEHQIAIRSRLLGPSHLEVAAAVANLAAIEKALGDYARAESLYARALSLQSAVLPPDHLEIAQTRNNQAALFWKLGRYREAEEGWRQALAIRRRRLPPGDPLIARTIQNLAIALQAEGDLAGAESLLREALAIKKSATGENDAGYANTLGNLAFVLNARGEPAQAEVLYRRALATLHDVLGEGHRDVADAREQLGMHLEDEGDHEGARALIEEALEAKRKSLGEDHPDVAATMMNLAAAVEGCGDAAEAERLHRESYRRLAARLGPDHPKVLKSLSALALLEDRAGDNAQAESLFALALAATRRVYPPDHPEVARAALNLSISLRKQGDCPAAMPLVEEAVAIRRRSFGPGHIQVASALRHSGTLYLLCGDRSRAIAALREAAEIFETARLRYDPGLARVTFLEAPYAMLAAALLLDGKPEEAWPAVEQDRGRALADLLRSADGRTLSAGERETQQALQRELGDRERALAALEAQTSGAEGLAALRETARGELLDAEARWAAFQRRIADREPVGEGRAFPLRRVQSALPAGAAIVGWLDVELTQDSSLAWGYVVRNEGPVSWARVAPIGSTERGRPAWLEALAASVGDRNAGAADLSAGARRLWKERWEPLEPSLAGATELIVAPSGPAAAIPIEALEDGAGRSLADRFAISYAPSATVLAWLSERSTPGWRPARPLLVGDPPFSDQQLAEGGDAEAPGTPPPSHIPVQLLRSGDLRGRGPLPRLPGTRAEVAAIDSAIGPSTVLLGAAASEQDLIRRAETRDLERHDVLHFATHALVDERRPERSALILSQAGLPQPLESVLAGTRVVDGAVTAGEVIREWHLDAELVALSACESGVGLTLRGEGTVGFAHAFLRSGARSVLVSLWRVDDRATALLMRRFYENLAGARPAGPGKPAGPMTKTEALREAKRWLRDYRTPGGRRPYAQPFFWSPFILVGDPGR